MKHLFSQLLLRPDFYAKRVMQWQLGLFVLGVVWCFVFPTQDSEAIAIILALLWLLSTIVNVVVLVSLFLKRPRLYLLYALFLILLPVVLGGCSFMAVIITSGYYC
ncbi:hypothetical protein ACLI1A_04030 [Flavobacterium sp. RHBU_3]|uniref:hypothetical protein n=1 Tax=Flavobacterium sp. RHBU_3 TaxID=3391184 RepID=UPI003984E032